MAKICPGLWCALLAALVTGFLLLILLENLTLVDCAEGIRYFGREIDFMFWRAAEFIDPTPQGPC